MAGAFIAQSVAELTLYYTFERLYITVATVTGTGSARGEECSDFRYAIR
jgi:hypothetical protein